jgi:hypothetical protein
MLQQTTDRLLELAFRESDGIEVALLWDAIDDGVLLTVRDGRTGEWFVSSIEGAEALDAFRHPFAYAARRRGGAQPPLRATA